MKELFQPYPRLSFFSLGFIAFFAVIMAGLWFFPPRSAASNLLFLVVVIPVLILRIRFGRSIRFLAFMGGLLSPFIVTESFISSVGLYERMQRRPFDAAAWRQNDRSDPSWPARPRMVDDLLEKELLRGMDRAQAERLLGAGDEHSRAHPDMLVYRLGRGRRVPSGGPELLVLRFDPSGRLREAVIERDN